MGVFVAAIALSVPLSIFRAYTLATLWMWFAVPTFGVRPIGKAAAYGLVLILSVAHQIPSKAADKDQSAAIRLIENAVECVAFCGFALIFGAVIRGWL